MARGAVAQHDFFCQFLSGGFGHTAFDKSGIVSGRQFFHFVRDFGVTGNFRFGDFCIAKSSIGVRQFRAFCGVIAFRGIFSVGLFKRFAALQFHIVDSIEQGGNLLEVVVNGGGITMRQDDAAGGNSKGAAFFEVPAALFHLFRGAALAAFCGYSKAGAWFKGPVFRRLILCFVFGVFIDCLGAGIRFCSLCGSRRLCVFSGALYFCGAGFIHKALHKFNAGGQVLNLALQASEFVHVLARFGFLHQSGTGIFLCFDFFEQFLDVHVFNLLKYYSGF